MFKKSNFNHRWYLGLVISIGIFFIGFVVYEASRAIKNEIALHDETSFKKVSFILREKIDSYVHGLQGMNGVYVVSDFNPSPELIRKYAASRDFFKNFPGALGYGFARRVENKSLPKYLDKRRSWSPDFNLKKLQAQENLDSYIVEVIEPFEKNAEARGLDIGSEPKRRDAAEKAMLSGEATLTAPIELVQAKKTDPGFILFLPLYSQPTLPDTIQDRKTKLVGWANTPILSSALIDFLEKSIESHLIIEIKDSTGEWIHRPTQKVDRRFHHSEDWMHDTLSVGGRKWIINGAIVPDSRYTLVNAASIIIFLLICAIYIAATFKLRKIILMKESSEDHIEEVESFTSAVLNGSNYAIISAFKDGTISTFNKAAEKMLGFTSQEMVGLQKPGIFHDPKEVQAMAKKLSEELGHDVPVGFETFAVMAEESSNPTAEWTYINKKGDRFPVRLSVSAMRDRSNQVIGYVGVVEDLTQIKKMEETIEYQRMGIISAGKMAALGEMAAGVAHEINNPLAIIAGRAGILLGMVEEGEIDKDFLKEGLSRIDATCLRIEKIVKGLRNFSRETSNDPMTLVEIGLIINDTLSLCRERVVKNNVNLTVEGVMGAELLCRPVQISQVLINLIGNSIDAIRDLQEKWIIIRVENKNNRLIISVTDSGSGIAPEVADKMMQPFYTTKEVGKGTGLGLSISKGIVEAHEGEMAYTLHQGHTRFEMTFSEKSV
jgi:PAS domain S-box-containing protein